MKNKILEKIEKINNYELWFTVKQNYDYLTVKRMIGKINKFTKEKPKLSFEDFVLLDATNKTDKNFRNARVLMNLNLLENDFYIEPRSKYENYQLTNDVINSYYLGDKELKKVISERMYLKEKIVVSKSNKKSKISDVNRTIYISPYKILIDILLQLNARTGATWVEKKEIIYFITTIESEKEINDALEAIIMYRNGKVTLLNKLTENRFHKTLALMNGFTENRDKIYFDVNILKQYSTLENMSLEKGEFIFNEEDYFEIRKSIVRKSGVQSQWKSKLSDEFMYKCAFCDISLPTLLKGSHLKPVSNSKDAKNFSEIDDISNGLLLCANHDQLIDKFIISIDIDGNIVGNKHGVATLQKIDNKFLTTSRKQFLEWHYEQYCARMK